MERSADASVCWLASKTDGNWLLVFDNADDVDLKLKTFFPSCSSGNILITTRNREIRHYTAKGADEHVKGLDLEDAKTLLLVQARVERSDENITLAETIVQVNYFLLVILLENPMLTYAGTLLLCAGRCPSRGFHSLPLVFKRVSETIPTRTRQFAAERGNSRTGPV